MRMSVFFFLWLLFGTGQAKRLGMGRKGEGSGGWDFGIWWRWGWKVEIGVKRNRKGVKKGHKNGRTKLTSHMITRLIPLLKPSPTPPIRTFLRLPLNIRPIRRLILSRPNIPLIFLTTPSFMPRHLMLEAAACLTSNTSHQVVETPCCSCVKRSMQLS